MEEMHSISIGFFVVPVCSTVEAGDPPTPFPGGRGGDAPQFQQKFLSAALLDLE